MTENYFSDEQKQKDAEAAAHFHIKAAKHSPGHYHFKEVCARGLNFFYFFLIRQTQHFHLLDHWFSGHRPSFAPPPLCQQATFIYCAKYVNTYTGKSFCWHKGWGGGRYAIKLFLISICFIVKKHSFCPKLSPCSIPKEKLIPLS